GAAMGALRLVGGRPPGRLAARLPGPVRAALALAGALPGRRRARLSPSFTPAGAPRGTAVLMTGCAPARLFPDDQLAAARLLQRAGVRVVVEPSERCCGALAL